MSEPKRYIFVHIGRDVWMHEPDNRMEAAPAGEYVSASDYAALAAENERLRSKLNFSQSISETCKQLYEGETITVQGAISSGKTILSCPCQCEQLTAENERLRAEVEWLRKADRLVCWNPTTQEWEVRHEASK